MRLADRFNAIATVVKVAPLLILLVGGWPRSIPPTWRWPEMPPLSQVAQTSAILIFAFLGVETALVPSGEVRDPERTVPRAVILAIVAVAVLYLGLHLVAQGVLGAALAQQKTPLAEAAGVALGGWARQAVLGASVLSMLIYASGMMLGVPRLLFAFARDGFAPSVAGRRASRVPHPARRDRRAGGAGGRARHLGDVRAPRAPRQRGGPPVLRRLLRRGLAAAAEGRAHDGDALRRAGRRDRAAHRPASSSAGCSAG